MKPITPDESADDTTTTTPPTPRPRLSLARPPDYHAEGKHRPPHYRPDGTLPFGIYFDYTQDRAGGWYVTVVLALSLSDGPYETQHQAWMAGILDTGDWCADHRVKTDLEENIYPAQDKY